MRIDSSSFQHMEMAREKILQGKWQFLEARGREVGITKIGDLVKPILNNLQATRREFSPKEIGGVILSALHEAIEHIEGAQSKSDEYQELANILLGTNILQQDPKRTLDYLLPHVAQYRLDKSAHFMLDHCSFSDFSMGSALCKAAEIGNRTLAERLIQSGKIPTWHPRNPAMVMNMIRGQEPDQKWGFWESAIRHAYLNGHTELAELLFNRYCNGEGPNLSSIWK